MNDWKNKKIGETKSGKPLYLDYRHSSHHSGKNKLTPSEHQEAAKKHNGLSNTMEKNLSKMSFKKRPQQSRDLAQKHRDAAQMHTVAHRSGYQGHASVAPFDQSHKFDLHKPSTRKAPGMTRTEHEKKAQHHSRQMDKHPAGSAKHSAHQKMYWHHMGKASAGLVMAKKAPSDVPSKHQLKILVDTVKNPLKGQFMGGPSAEDAKKTLKSKFQWTDNEIKKLEASIGENMGLKRLHQRLLTAGIDADIIGQCIVTDVIAAPKKGTGSRGGQIVGKTKSGKPIYKVHNHDNHKSWKKEDHIDAHQHFLKKMVNSDGGLNNKDQHRMSFHHFNILGDKKAAKSHSDAIKNKLEYGTGPGTGVPSRKHKKSKETPKRRSAIKYADGTWLHSDRRQKGKRRKKWQTEKRSGTQRRKAEASIMVIAKRKQKTCTHDNCDLKFPHRETSKGCHKHPDHPKFAGAGVANRKGKK